MENLAFLFIAGYIGDAIMIYLTYRDFKRAQVAPGSREVAGDVASFRVMIQRRARLHSCQNEKGVSKPACHGTVIRRPLDVVRDLTSR